MGIWEFHNFENLGIMGIWEFPKFPQTFWEIPKKKDSKNVGIWEFPKFAFLGIMGIWEFPKFPHSQIPKNANLGNFQSKSLEISQNILF